MASVSSTTADPGAALFAALNGAADKKSDGKIDIQNRFLTLLTAQLRNQDPLSPLDNSQMTSQLAQISTVDGIERLNATLQTMMGNSSDASVFQAAALVGHQVLVPGAGMQLEKGNKAFAAIELSEPADRARITIRDAKGDVVRSFDLKELKAGANIFEWNGKTDADKEADGGVYTYSVEAVRGEEKVAADALQFGKVSSIVRSAHGVTLNVGTIGAFKLDDIRQII